MDGPWRLQSRERGAARDLERPSRRAPRVDDGGEPFSLVSRAALLRARARCARASSIAIFLASETLSLAPIPDPRSPIPHARTRAQDLVFDMVQATCLPETPARIRPKRERLGIVTAGAVANVARGSPGFPVGTTNAAERIELVAAEILPSLVDVRRARLA